MLLRHVTRILAQLITLLKISLASQFTTNSMIKNVSLLASYAKSFSFDFMFNHKPVLFAQNNKHHSLLRRQLSHACSPKFLLLIQFSWIIPYIFVSNCIIYVYYN